MILSWFKRRRRRRILSKPLPEHWLKYLFANIWQFARLPANEQSRLQQDVQILVAEKNWEGCGGLNINDEIKVTISAQISLLTLGWQPSYFEKVTSILVYPGAYVAPQRQANSAGVVTEGNSGRIGEAWLGGPVILSWPDVLAGGRNEADGHNVVVHEFVHQLDMLDGEAADGIPPLPSREQLDRWRHITTREYQQLVHDCRHNHANVLDCYGAEHPSEFFAVATELFFQQPEVMRHRHGELYQLLCDYFRQDPAAREIVTGPHERSRQCFACNAAARANSIALG